MYLLWGVARRKERKDYVTEEFKKRLADYFTGPELVELLDIPIEELIEALYDYIEEKETELDEYTQYGTR